MKPYRLLTAAACAITLFSSCNHNDEPPAEVLLPIHDIYLPCSETIDRNDADLVERYREWNNKVLIVNSPDQLPDDPIGFNESYTSGINFNDESLLLVYRIFPFGGIDTYRCRFAKNNLENRYEWGISIGSSDYDTDDDGKRTFNRFAISIRKLPADAELYVWWSLTDYNFTWDSSD